MPLENVESHVHAKMNGQERKDPKVLTLNNHSTQHKLGNVLKCLNTEPVCNTERGISLFMSWDSTHGYFHQNIS